MISPAFSPGSGSSTVGGDEVQGDGEKGIPFFFPKEKRYVPIDVDVMNIFFLKGICRFKKNLVAGIH